VSRTTVPTFWRTCPNDHVRFDTGAIYIDHNYGVRESAATRHSVFSSCGQVTSRITTISHTIANTSVARPGANSEKKPDG
jgi:hypothetical protein